ncbi:RNB domain-containing ribonuclease [Cellulomonas soli]|uniref:Ribonuclease R n=1 Tax=Cellulomonas soli TaxID=931535 RepID=A0A512PCH3_9CELL|nr:RNB domain-containing ribonuclease [Cellulomonas soli]NYI58444.1 exoribonuclease R [Cellulomonas soli]GEP68866.1 ribonuclease R [Cellulomonas soli]
MPRRHVRLRPAPLPAVPGAEPPAEVSVQTVDRAVRTGLAAVRAELQVPDAFPPQVVAAARSAAPQVPSGTADATHVPFVTIDPAGSMDLDQALHIERRGGPGGGFRVHYAIADVAAWVPAGGPVDTEARRRVVTLYAPDGRTPLHPPELSEAAASLLPDGERPALWWQLDLDGDGQLTRFDVRRATVRSRARLTYEQVEHALDTGTADDVLVLLREVGLLREQVERERGGLTLPMPEQEAGREDGHWALTSRRTLPVEGWNAQVSLLTGMAAASLMLDGGIGVLRTLPAADPRDVARLRRTAQALGVPWPEGAGHAEVVSGLDSSDPAQAALLTEAATLMRGAAYVAFDGQRPAYVEHAAIAAPYAHTTAPLRRLVDRFVGETCLALCADVPVPEWVRAALPDLPSRMASGDAHASAYERACLDLVEAALLAGRTGEVFDAVVVDVREDRAAGVVQLRDPAVRARVGGEGLPLGEAVRVRLTDVSVTGRTVRFTLER